MKLALGVVGILAGLFLLLPVFAAGTLDPCEASVRTYIEKKGPPEGGGVFGEFIAVRLGTEMLRTQAGTLGCYRALLKVMDEPSRR